MNATIQKIFETGQVTGRSGKVYQLDYCVDLDEGEFLTSIIQDDPGVVKTLEVGCAYGISSLFISSAIHGRNGAFHTIVDPFQNSEWDGVGIKNLEDAGFDYFDLIENKSEFALPQLLEKGEGQFDFIFIDGWHTFDHTLIDCFYATRLLRVGGYLAIDDVGFQSVRRVVNFLSNYPCYEFHGSVSLKKKRKVRPFLLRCLMFPVRRSFWAKVLSPSYYQWIFENRIPDMVALKKISEDKRNWDWHNDVF
jgi:hypothetical protein